MDEVIYVVYAPYLPLEKRVTIGPCELVPRAMLLDDDAVDAEAAMLARLRGPV